MIVSKNFRIGFLNINENLKIKNSAILNLFAEMAGVHSEQLGDGFGSSNFRWLLTAYKVHIIKRPGHGDDVTVTTWSSDYKPAIAAREFEIRDTDGNLLITGLSNWVLVDFTTKRLAKITPEYMHRYETQFQRTNFESSRLMKLSEPECYLTSYDEFIDWKWMDMNKHMNNTYYPEIAEHYLPEDVREKISSCDFEVLYKKEIPENTNVKCLYAETNDSYVVTFKSEDLSVLHAIVKYSK